VNGPVVSYRIRMPTHAAIYYVPTDASGQEIGEPIPVTLGADGVADLSALPEDLRQRLAFGVPDEMHRGKVKPEEGERFLEALLLSSNPYRRFRASPDASVV